MLSELYQEVILDHGKKPRNFGQLASATHQAEGYNTLCGDRVIVQVEMDGETVRNIQFVGAGCAICMASTSMMTSFVKGKSINEIEGVFEVFHSAVTGGEADMEPLGDLEALVGVKQYPNRIKCATLGWHALSSAFKSPIQEEK
ncbi:MAG: SUF system NifU family Fe-S cluster assembly protein [Fimbriimonadaceae bacterium]|nr:SUF system NifU family Fe-S cluster assembly protein [Fimbriimonadaceae bacterium]